MKKLKEGGSNHMPKKSRRERRLLKEKEERRAADFKKAGKPFSKHKIKICYHYGVGYKGMEIAVHCDVHAHMVIPAYLYSNLRKHSNDTYICLVCGKVFTSEQAAKIEALCKYYETTLVKSKTTFSELMTEDILPCRYYHTAPDEKVICGTEKVVPLFGGIWTE